MVDFMEIAGATAAAAWMCGGAGIENLVETLYDKVNYKQRTIFDSVYRDTTVNNKVAFLHY